MDNQAPHIKINTPRIKISINLKSRVFWVVFSVALTGFLVGGMIAWKKIPEHEWVQKGVAQWEDWVRKSDGGYYRITKTYYRDKNPIRFWGAVWMEMSGPSMPLMWYAFGGMLLPFLAAIPVGFMIDLKRRKDSGNEIASGSATGTGRE